MNLHSLPCCLAVGCTCLLLSGRADAQRPELRYDPWVDGSITLWRTAARVGSQAAMDR